MLYYTTCTVKTTTADLLWKPCPHSTSRPIGVLFQLYLIGWATHKANVYIYSVSLEKKCFATAGSAHCYGVGTAWLYVLCCAVWRCAVRCGAVRCGAVRCSAVRCGAVLCSVLCCAVLCAVLCCAVLYRNVM